MYEPLARNKNDKQISGVCSGIARSYHLDVTMVRVVTLILSISIIVLILYLILSLILKEE